MVDSNYNGGISEHHLVAVRAHLIEKTSGQWDMITDFDLFPAMTQW